MSSLIGSQLELLITLICPQHVELGKHGNDAIYFKATKTRGPSKGLSSTLKKREKKKQNYANTPMQYSANLNSGKNYNIQMQKM